MRKQAAPEEKEYAKDCDDNIQIHLKKVLNRNLTVQFGTKAPEKLKRLLFMVRENQDVFKIFCEKFVEFQMQYSYLTFIDSLINYFFDTLTDQAASQKLSYFVYWTTVNTFRFGKFIVEQGDQAQGEQSGEQDKLIKLAKLRLKIFSALQGTFEAKQYTSSIFLQKFERFDMDYLNMTNVYQQTID